MPTRRQFIKVGLAGAAVLVAARLLAPTRDAPSPAFKVLGPDSVGVMMAVVPVVLAGSLPADAAARSAALDQVIEAFDRAITGLSPAVQAEIGELLDVLRYAPTRVALAGITGSWAKASPESIAAFLQRWRTSRFDLLRSGYQALTQLIQAAWYDNPLAWKAIGYPGPPALVAPRGS